MKVEEVVEALDERNCAIAPLVLLRIRQNNSVYDSMHLREIDSSGTVCYFDRTTERFRM